MKDESLESRYPALTVRLEVWADWQRGSRNLPGVNYTGYSQSSPMARLVVMKENAALNGSGLVAALTPVIVDEIESAVNRLPRDWREAVICQWIRRLPAKLAARRMHMSLERAHSCRVHAYGALMESLWSPVDGTA